VIDGLRRRRPDNAGASTTQTSIFARLGLGSRLAKHGVSANLVTLFGVALAAVTAVLLGFGELWVAVILITVGGLMDTLDGAVAKAAGSSSRRGAFVDSVSDRVGDALIFGGLTWHLLVTGDPRWAILPVAIVGVASVISYQRAKAESLGMTARGGLMERAERLIVLCLALLIPPAFYGLLIALLVLSCATALGRFIRIWGQAGEAQPAVTRRHPTSVSMEARWRAFRDPAMGRTTRRPRRERQALAVRLRTVLSSEQAHRSRPAGRMRSAKAAQRRLDRDH
jgi:CDP-diacylglycerol---glycerol-3-phosphate 3-phosphatidyltransferase